VGEKEKVTQALVEYGIADTIAIPSEAKQLFQATS
jgi:hypothetical protein